MTSEMKTLKIKTTLKKEDDITQKLRQSHPQNKDDLTKRTTYLNFVLALRGHSLRGNFFYVDQFAIPLFLRGKQAQN